ncbi:DUF333 domain-containing protein [Bdellovibrio bacteriovorus]|uniref:DUF333 domain-containing protein n=1 Tax=Bdellovibrio bacteriovorus TaxID=959 RepID=UPI003A804A8C
MRQIFTLLVLFLVLMTVNAGAAPVRKLKMFTPETKKYVVVSVLDYQGLTLSESCLKNGKMNCDAWKAAQTKLDVAKTPNVGVIGNPAARYCLSHKALNRILLDAKKAEYDYCVFPDGSVIDSWTLYNKHFSKKQ